MPTKQELLLNELSAAINRSESHTEIVYLAVDNVKEARIMLSTMVDDPIETDWVTANDDVTQVWAFDPAADEGDMIWRIHLTEQTKSYRCYQAVRNSVGGLDSVGAGWVEVEAESAESAAESYADTLRDCEQCIGLIAVSTDDNGDSAEVQI